MEIRNGKDLPYIRILNDSTILEKINLDILLRIVESSREPKFLTFLYLYL